jgi:hypothetical protein
MNYIELYLDRTDSGLFKHDDNIGLLKIKYLLSTVKFIGLS